jgi:hypothetical protein
MRRNSFARLACAAVCCCAAATGMAQAQPLPRDDRERNCWLLHSKERTAVKLAEPTAVEVSNLRDGDVVRSPFRIDFAIRGMGVIPAGKPHPKAGHHHLLVDTALPMNPGDKIPFSDFHRHFGKGQTGTVIALPPGKHTLRLLFADHEHRPYFVFSPELRITVSGPRTDQPVRLDPADFNTSCRAWYDEERSRPRPEGQRVLISNLRDGEPVVSPFSVRFAVDGFGVAPRGQGGDGLGHFVFDVLRPDGGTVQNFDLANGATQVSLFLVPANYRLRLRFVDDAGRRDLVPPSELSVSVVSQERF